MKLYEFAEKVYAAQAAGKHVTRLFIGELDAPTPPEITTAGIAALTAGQTKYASAYGETALRQAIAKRHGVGVERVVVTPGSKFAIFATLRALVKPGENVVLFAPNWPGLNAIASSLGITLKTIPTDLKNNWKPDAKKLEAAIDEKTRVVYCCNPNNPTSTVISPKDVQALAKVSHSRGVPFLLDEAYRGLAFDPLGEQLKTDDDLNIIAGSFSKGFAMTGWRCGYLIAKPSLVDSLAALAQSTYSCVPQFVQSAALAGLGVSGLERRLTPEYAARGKLVTKILKGAFDFAPPQSGIYAFVGRKGLDGDAFALSLLKNENIAVAPGSAFGYPEYLRITLAQELPELERSLTRIRAAAERFQA